MIGKPIKIQAARLGNRNLKNDKNLVKSKTSLFKSDVGSFNTFVKGIEGKSMSIEDCTISSDDEETTLKGINNYCDKEDEKRRSEDSEKGK